MVVEPWNRQFGCETIRTTQSKVYFNEFYENILRDNMGMIIFDL